MPLMTMILVHGALLTSSVWMPVQSYLQNRGYNVVTLDVPGRAADDLSPKEVSLQLAAQKVCKVAQMQAGKVILIAHSQAGAVITEATSICGENIAALLYVAAVVPLSGEKAFDLLSDEDALNFEKVAALDQPAGLYRIKPDAPIKAMFMADATDGAAELAIANMVDEPARLGDDKLDYNETVFKAIPKYYIKTSQDKIISPVTQNKYMMRTHFEKVMTINSSHSPFISNPHRLAGMIVDLIHG